MSEVISFNTQEEIEQSFKEQKPIDIFALVDENSPILRQKLEEFDFSNPPINPNEFASTLVETCRIKGGFGLSANQCGFEHRVFVMGAEDEFVACYNPKILAKSVEESMIAEGCLSFPMLALKITRPKEIQVEYYDFNGERHETTFSGMTAHIFQHELDHIDGICYTERAKPLALKMGLKKRGKFNKLLDRYNLAQKVMKTVGK